MIYCLNCGKGIPDQSKFCTFCGTAIKGVEAPLAESVIPPASQQFTNITQEQQYANPTPPPEYVNPTPPPPQYVTTPPPPQYINPTSQSAPSQYANTIVTSSSTVSAKNEFYKNAGFWGAVLALVGFFLPYVTGNDASFYYLVSDLAPDNPELYLYLVFPVSAAILIIQGLTGILPKFVVVIFKILPLLMLILLVIGLSQANSNLGFMGDDVGSVMKNIGVGLYMTVIGTLLMLFFKTTKTK